jgi:hypothetical protein
METKNSNILPVALLATALLGVMIASGFIISAATAQSNTTEVNSTNNVTTMNTSSSSDDPVVTQIDAAIGTIKDGKSDEGRKLLFEAEKLMEGKPSIADSEKRVEAAIKALSDGDSNGSIGQAEEAKKSLVAR